MRATELLLQASRAGLVGELLEHPIELCSSLVELALVQGRLCQVQPRVDVVRIDLERPLRQSEASLGRLTADGAYDTRAIYEVLATVGLAGVDIVIPPRRTASPSNPAEEVLRQRDAAIARIAEVGRRQWRKESGAHQQARAENGMSRYKRIIGDRLRAKKLGAQTREAMLAVNVLNRMTALGMPDSVAVAV